MSVQERHFLLSVTPPSAASPHPRSGPLPFQPALAVLIGRKKWPGFHGVPTAGSSHRSSPIQPALRHANTSHVAIANSIPLVDADPAMMKLQFIMPPKKAPIPTNAPRINAVATASSPKMISLENQVWASTFTRYSMKLRYQS